jgi:hypothetical protein
MDVERWERLRGLYAVSVSLTYSGLDRLLLGLVGGALIVAVCGRAAMRKDPARARMSSKVQHHRGVPGDRRSDPFCLAGLPPWKPFLRHTPQPLRHSLYSAGCTVYITSRLRLKCRALFGPGNGYRAPPRRSTTISRVSVLTLTRGRVDAYPMRRDSNRQPALRVLGAAERPARVSPSKPAVARPRRCTYVVHTRDEERAF